jgi:hypothetical protein
MNRSLSILLLLALLAPAPIRAAGPGHYDFGLGEGYAFSGYVLEVGDDALERMMGFLAKPPAGAGADFASILRLVTTTELDPGGARVPVESIPPNRLTNHARNLIARDRQEAFYRYLQHLERRIDFDPVASELHALLGGTLRDRFELSRLAAERARLAEQHLALDRDAERARRAGRLIAWLEGRVEMPGIASAVDLLTRPLPRGGADRPNRSLYQVMVQHHRHFAGAPGSAFLALGPEMGQTFLAYLDVEGRIAGAEESLGTRSESLRAKLHGLARQRHFDDLRVLTAFHTFLFPPSRQLPAADLRPDGSSPSIYEFERLALAARAEARSLLQHAAREQSEGRGTTALGHTLRAFLLVEHLELRDYRIPPTLAAFAGNLASRHRNYAQARQRRDLAAADALLALLAESTDLSPTWLARERTEIVQARREAEGAVAALDLLLSPQALSNPEMRDEFVRLHRRASQLWPSNPGLAALQPRAMELVGALSEADAGLLREALQTRTAEVQMPR